MKVYLAGPMRGLSEWNYPAFAEAKDWWEKAGWQVFCPATLADAMGYNFDTPCEPGGGSAHLRHVIQSDVLCLTNADAIALLPGWEKSRGATVELALAQFLGLKVFDAVTMREISPVGVPWAYLDSEVDSDSL